MPVQNNALLWAQAGPDLSFMHSTSYSSRTASRLLRTLAVAAAIAITTVNFAAVGTVEISSSAPALEPRKVSPPLASLAAPKAAGPLRILLVDDDWSSNNQDGSRS